MLIEIEGIDASGKATQSHLLAERLRREGKKVQIFSFPDYNSIQGKQIRNLLQSNIQTDPVVIQSLMTIDRYDKQPYIKEAIRNGCIVICDRYIASGYAYGGCEGVPWEWLYRIQKELIKPDITIILDIDPNESMKRKQAVDYYERNINFLMQIRQEYKAYLESPYNDAKYFASISANNTIQHIHESIYSIISNYKKFIKNNNIGGE